MSFEKNNTKKCEDCGKNVSMKLIQKMEQCAQYIVTSDCDCGKYEVNQIIDLNC